MSKMIFSTFLLDGNIVIDSNNESASLYALKSLATRWLALHEEIKGHIKLLEQLVEEVCPELLGKVGIGHDNAAELLCAFGDNPERITSKAKFAKICGVCLIPEEQIGKDLIERVTVTQMLHYIGLPWFAYALMKTQLHTLKKEQRRTSLKKLV